MKYDKKKLNNTRFDDFKKLGLFSDLKCFNRLRHTLQIICLVWLLLQLIQTKHSAIRWHLDTTASGYLPAIRLSWEKYINEPACDHQLMAATPEVSKSKQISPQTLLVQHHQPGPLWQPVCRFSPNDSK